MEHELLRGRCEGFLCLPFLAVRILAPKLTDKFHSVVVPWLHWPFPVVLSAQTYWEDPLHHPVSPLASVNASGLTALCLCLRK